MYTIYTKRNISGLRSGKVGEQCEAIVRFPRLFEKYPFPILINASLLKLSDVFRVGLVVVKSILARLKCLISEIISYECAY